MKIVCLVRIYNYISFLSLILAQDERWRRVLGNRADATSNVQPVTDNLRLVLYFNHGI